MTGESRAVRAERLFRDGAALFAQQNYPAAAVQFHGAFQIDARQARYAAQLGLAREHLQQYGEAAEAYRAGLKVVGPDEELRQELVYRLALLEAFRLGHPQVTRELLAGLPAESSYAADLRAVLLLISGDGRGALRELNIARAANLSAEQAAIILYHAARAYHLSGDDRQAMAMLFESINTAGYAPITKDIEEFKDLLQSSRP